MAKTINKKISVKTSADKPLGKPLPGNKTLVIEPVVRFHAIKYSENTEEGEEVEIIFIYNSNLSISKQKLVKRKFPYIDTFDPEGPTIVYAMCNLTV